MAYVRHTHDGSDVYVYRTDRHLICGWCKFGSVEPWMNGNEYVSNIEFQLSYQGLKSVLEHLMLHRKAGHCVPEYAFERLVKQVPADFPECERHLRERGEALTW